MFDYVSKINELYTNRFCCSQILISLALEIKGCENAEVRRELLRAMSGLCRGMENGKDCGALTGGACAIGLICGRGENDEIPHNMLKEMLKELTEWFEYEYGSVECSVLTGGDIQRCKEMCPGIIRRTFENAVRIMQDNGVGINLDIVGC
jgi:C_GCAxxG_C_C family probable redox protein